jgi:hypothetical protein
VLHTASPAASKSSRSFSASAMRNLLLIDEGHLLRLAVLASERCPRVDLCSREKEATAPEHFQIVPKASIRHGMQPDGPREKAPFPGPLWSG